MIQINSLMEIHWWLQNEHQLTTGTERTPLQFSREALRPSGPRFLPVLCAQFAS